VSFASGSILSDSDLNKANDQARFLGLEAVDRANDAMVIDPDDSTQYDIQVSGADKRIYGVEDPTNSNDAASKAYVDGVAMGSGASIVTTTGEQTLTNKTLTSPKINEDVVLSATATELNVMDAGATVTTPTVASGDAFVMDDLSEGMCQVDIDNVDTYLSQTASALTNKTSVEVDNLKLDGNTLSSTDNDGNIDITPHGTGEVNISKVDIDAGAIDDVTITNPKLNEDVVLGATATELNTLDGVTAGTVTASKAVVVDANKDLTGIRNLIITGGISASTYYGVSWDESGDSYTRTGALTGVATGSSPSEFMAVHAGMKRCVLADDGGVVYFLDPDDSTKKADGTASVLTGADGQVMVQIPKFWYKYGYSGSTHTWEISSIPVEGFEVHPAFIKNGSEVDFRYIGAYEGVKWDQGTTSYVDGVSHGIDTGADKLSSVSGYAPWTDEKREEFRLVAAERGTGWRQLDYDLLSAVQLLYLVEYADFDSQSMIGEGRTQLSGGTWVKGSYIKETGLSNGDGNATNSVDWSGDADDADAETVYMTYRGIENWYGNVWKFVDGININNNVPYVSNDDSNWADDTSTNYTDLGITLHNGNGYQTTLEQTSRGFLPSAVGGSSSTYITDYYYQNSDWRVVSFGGTANSGSYAGGFSLYAYADSSYDAVDIGGRLAY
jgi:outer membrane lipoprotein SlyB